MKTADIVTRTVIYAGAERHHVDHPDRLVVLSTTVHRLSIERLGDGKVTRVLTPTPGYRPQGTSGRWSSDAYGLPVLVVTRFSEAAPNDDLLAAAAALPEHLAGVVPALPRGISIQVVRPQDIGITWAEHVARQTTRAAEVDKYRARRAELAAAQQHARRAVATLLDQYHVPAQALHSTNELSVGSTRVAELEWEDLYGILSDLVTGVVVWTRGGQTDRDHATWSQLRGGA